MLAGKLRKRIQLRTPGDSQNEIGEMVRGWVLVDTIWGGITPAREVEKLTAGQTVAEKDLSITIRYRDDVTTQHQITWGSQRYEIVGITNPEMKNEKLIIFCKETK